MNKMIILQQPSSTSLVDNYLFESHSNDLELVLITGKGSKRKDYHKNTRVVILEDYFAEESFGEICKIVENFNPDFISSNSEKDVYRVSCIRSLYNIIGLKSNFGILFRNKVKMKILFKMADIPNIPYCHPFSIEDILDFQKKYKKVVLKPISGAGSVGVVIFERQEDIKNHFKNNSIIKELFIGNYIVEEFIDGDVFHVDVLSYRNNPLLILPAKYVNPPHEFSHKNIGGVLLDEHSPEHQVLEKFARDIFNVLPENEYITAIHFEAFRDEKGNYYAGEVAARSGGGMIKDNISQKYDINLSLTSYDLWISPKKIEKDLNKSQNKLSYGYFMITGDTYDVNILNKEDFEIEKLWISDDKSKNQAVSSVDAKAGILLKGGNEKEVFKRIREIENAIRKYD